MRPAKDFLEKEYPILNERLCNRLMRGSVVGVMEDYAREVAKEALIEAARKASEYIYDLEIDNSIIHPLIRKITDSKNIPVTP